MKIPKVPKSTEIFLVFSLLFFASVIFYTVRNQATNNGRSRLLEDQHELGERKLKRVLQRAAMPDRTVILTILSREWASPGSVFDIFLEGFRTGQGTERFLNHLVVLTVDDQAFEYCRLKHSNCFNLANYRFNYETWKPFQNLRHLKLGWRKIEAIGEILDLGHHVLFTDVDVLWLRNPFQHFDPTSEIHTACDPYNSGDPQSDTTKPDAGFQFFKSDAISAEFFNYLKMARVLRPNSSDELAFANIKDDAYSRGIGLRIKYLEANYFASLCQQSIDLGKVRTVHAKCYNSTESKVRQLRRVLDEWKKFRVPSEGENGFEDSRSGTS